MAIMKFRTKPSEIEAVKAADAVYFAARDWKALPEWVKVAYESGDLIFESDKIQVRTNHGVATAELSDWLILGLHDEVYPCSDLVFRSKYEVVNET